MDKGHKRAVVVWGGWDGHEPKQSAERFIPSLRERGYGVEKRSDLSVFARAEYMRNVDLIVLSYSMATLASDEERGLCDAVAAGTGIAGWHGAATFTSNPDYAMMLGGQFVAHPGGEIDYTVTIVRDDDPITRGLADFRVHSEQYYLHVDPSNEVLATTDFSANTAEWRVGSVMPVVWKRRWGAGKVFYSSLGHRAADFDTPEVAEITRRGILWAAR